MTKLETILICIIAGILIAGGFAFYFEHRGAKECVQADTAAVAKQEASNEAKETKATQVIAIEDTTHEEAISAPVLPTPAITCVRTYQSRPVLPTAKPASIGNGAPDSPKENSGQTGIDPSADLKAIGRDADAQIVELQDYITKVCLVR